MGEFLDKILVPVLIAIVSAGGTYLVTLAKKTAKEQKANNFGTMLVLRTFLIDMHEKYINKGSITSFAFDNYCDMYNAYKGLGGNGMIDKMKVEIDNLKLQRKED